MGFLMGAFGKLQAGARMRNIQYRLTGVQRRLRSVTRQIGDKEKANQRYMNQLKNNMTMQMNMFCNSVMMQAGLGDYSMAFGNTAALQGLYNQAAADDKFATKYNVAMQMRQNAQMWFTQMSSMYQEQMEAEIEADLQALKDYESELQVEKESLESELKIAQADYEANKEMEKQGPQNMKPDYTGQG